MKITRGIGKCVCILALAGGMACEVSYALDEPGAITGQMVRAYSAFEDLQYYLLSEERFTAPQNEKKIIALLDTLSQSFASVKQEKTRLDDQPGFGETLTIINEHIQDAARRFKEGRKGYALWELKTIGNYCVSCHTTYSVETRFSDSLDRMQGMSRMERAEFFLATRQFDKAIPLFLQEVRSASSPRDRMSALRKWVVVAIRVYQDPRQALKELDTLLRDPKFTSFEKAELREYHAAFARWVNEQSNQQPSLRRAENLIRQGLGMNDLLDEKKSTVELLRATAMLHDLLDADSDLDSPPKDPDRGRILYLLGLSYSKLPLFFVNELPEFFLELCIRENPATRVARDCYRLYASNTYMDFTGSRGTTLPDDVQEKMGRLYSLAYGR